MDLVINVKRRELLSLLNYALVYQLNCFYCNRFLLQSNIHKLYKHKVYIYIKTEGGLLGVNFYTQRIGYITSYFFLTLIKIKNFVK